MKKSILCLFICLLSVLCYGYGQVYKTTNSNDPRANSRIGYTTNYGYGFRQNPTPVSYNPIAASQPRRITVYNGSGGTAETPGGNSDSSDWLYMYDEATGIWYCSKDGGKTWFEYRSTNGLGEWIVALLTGQPTGATWRSVDTPPSEGATHFAPDPDDPFLQPVGDVPIISLIIFLCIYCLSYKRV